MAKKHQIILSVSDLQDLKYKVLGLIVHGDFETDTERYDALCELLSALERASELSEDECNLSLTRAQTLRLAFLILKDMDQKTNFDDGSAEYHWLFQTLVNLGIVREEEVQDLGWLTPKVYKSKSDPDEDEDE